jgi:hypothetical protein
MQEFPVVLAIVFALAIVVTAVIAGRRRRDRPIEIVLNAAGGIAFIAGLGWAMVLGNAAFAAAAVASLGGVLWAEASRIGRQGQRQPSDIH